VFSSGFEFGGVRCLIWLSLPSGGSTVTSLDSGWKSEDSLESLRVTGEGNWEFLNVTSSRLSCCPDIRAERRTFLLSSLSPSDF